MVFVYSLDALHPITALTLHALRPSPMLSLHCRSMRLIMWCEMCLRLSVITQNVERHNEFHSKVISPQRGYSRGNQIKERAEDLLMQSVLNIRKTMIVEE